MYWKGKTITIEREDLYKKVWQTPVYRLASEYGISDVGLKKICTQLKVPTPPRGYWTKLEHGLKVMPEPLPELKAGDSTKYYLKQHPKLKHEEIHELSEDAQEIIARLKRALPIRVPATLRNPHGMIVATREALKNAKPDRYGMLSAWADGCVDIKVGPDSVGRALRVMNSVINFLHSQNLTLFSERGKRKRITYIKLFKETVAFGIKGRSHQHTKTPEEKKHSWESDLYFVPRDELTLFINERFGTGYRTQWSDTNSKRVEDLISDFLVELVVTADAKRQATQRLLEEEAMRTEERERVAKIRRREEAEAARLKHLEHLADRWRQSTNLRDFIAATVQRASVMELSEVDQRKFDEWISWAKQHAERLDPLSGGLPHTR